MTFKFLSLSSNLSLLAYVNTLGRAVRCPKTNIVQAGYHMVHLVGCVLGNPPADSILTAIACLCMRFFCRQDRSFHAETKIPIPLHLPLTTDSLSIMSPKQFFHDLKQRTRKSRPAMSGNQVPLAAQGTTVIPGPDPTCHIDPHDDITMNAIQTSLTVLKEGSSLATNLPFIAPIAGLLLQALTMRDEVKQYKGECEIVLGKLARIAGIVVDVCEKYNLSEEELPSPLRNILSSLQRELDRIELVLQKCSKRRGIKGFLLRKDLLTRIKRCDVELSNVLQAFQVRLILIRVTQVTYLPVGRTRIGHSVCNDCGEKRGGHGNVN
ncbi:hypothetical protein H4582DRAFT_746291 [Lactarius indigo]|nr:hypothetical protein H4582DRAFT_746291 [Lactarius indigo]